MTLLMTRKHFKWSAVARRPSPASSAPSAHREPAPATSTAGGEHERPPWEGAGSRRVGCTERHAAQPQRRRRLSVRQRVAVRPHQRLNGLLHLHPTATGTASLEMTLDDDSIRRTDVAINVRRDERIDPITVSHGGSALQGFPPEAAARGWSPTATDRTAINWSVSKRRTGETRDMTVPTGIISILAMSAYENSSTSRNHTA